MVFGHRSWQKIIVQPSGLAGFGLVALKSGKVHLPSSTHETYLKLLLEWLKYTSKKVLFF